MKNVFFIMALLIIPFSICGQIKGVTETGDEVLLHENGTWQYLSDSINVKVETIKNDTLFAKSEKSKFLVKSEKINIGVHINPKEWNFSKGEINSPTELTFKYKNKDLYGMLITENIEIPLESLADIAFNNAKGVATDVKLVKKELRNVNGIEVIMMQMTGTIQGIKFIYYGYYFSNSNGACQLLTYTSQNLFNEFENDMLTLINGFVLIE